MSSEIIGLDNLKKLFEKEDIFNLEAFFDSTEQKPTSFNGYSMSPYTKKIYDSIPDEEKSDFLKNIIDDDKKIQIIENNELDMAYNPEYLLYDYLEYFISYFFKCPVCKKKTLKKYANISMPVIDILCINEEHPLDRTRFFQIKTTSGNLFNGKPYFSKKKKFIHVGSYRYGYNIHNITNFTEEKYKNMLIGYICIEYKVDGNFIKINRKNSFYIIPDIADFPRYIYNETNNKILHFYTEPLEITDLYNSNNIYRYYFFKPTRIRNRLYLPRQKLEYDKHDKYYKLYIKYKTKYNKFNKIK